MNLTLSITSSGPWTISSLRFVRATLYWRAVANASRMLRYVFSVELAAWLQIELKRTCEITKSLMLPDAGLSGHIFVEALESGHGGAFDTWNQGPICCRHIHCRFQRSFIELRRRKTPDRILRHQGYPTQLRRSGGGDGRVGPAASRSRT